MARINFIYRSTKDTANLTIRITDGKFSKSDKENTEKIIDGKLRLSVSRDYWKKYLRQTQEKNGKLYKAKQKRIKDIELSNYDIEIKIELNKIKNFLLDAIDKTPVTLITKEWLNKTLKNYYNRDSGKAEIPQDLISFVDYYIEKKKDEISISTIKKLKVVKHKLERFAKETHVSILIPEINEQFKDDFVEYCKSENYAMGTIERDLKFIRSFCNYACERGLKVSRDLNKVRVKFKTDIKPIFLTFEELEIIENTDYNESLSNVRDWLIISCYTGQRVSDFITFSSSMIRVESDKTLLEFTQKKTGKIMTIPLHPKVLKILEKRGGKFPKPISDQKYNDYLKEVCHIAGINQKIEGSKKVEVEPDSGKYRKEEGTYEKWELISSHVGRRSFASNFYGRIPTNYLIYITGHSTETMFLNYIGKSNKDLALEITSYFN